MAINEQEGKVMGAASSISNVISALQKQAKDAIIDIDTLTGVAIENIVDKSSEISNSILVKSSAESLDVQSVASSSTIIERAIFNVKQLVPNILKAVFNVQNMAPRANTSPLNTQPLTGAARPPSVPRTNGNAPTSGDSNSQLVLPNLDSVFKNLLFGLVPKTVIRGYVSKVKFLIDQLQKIQVPEKNLAPIIEPLEAISKAIDTFSNISWAKAFFGIKAFQFFTKSFVASINKILSPETLDGLNKFSKFSEKLSKPLGEVSDSINNFASISWGKVLLGSKVFISFIKSFAKIPVEIFVKTGTAIATLAQKLKKPLESLGDTIERFGKSLSEFVGPLLKGAAAIALLGASLIPLAYGLKMFDDVNLESIGKAIITLGGLVLLAKGLGQSVGSILKGAAAIAILGASIIPLTYGLKMMENIGIGTIGVLAAGLTTLGIAAALFGSSAPLIAIGAGMLALLGAALIPFSFALKMLSEANPETLSNLAMPLLKLGGALLLGAPGLLLGGAALIPFSAGLATLGLALKLFNAETLDSIIPALTKLPDVAWSLAKAAPALVLSALALTPFSVAVAALGLAVKIGGDGLLEFMDTMSNFTQNLDPGKLFATAGAIVALSGAVAAFGAAQAAEGLGNLVGRFLRFGADSPLEQMQKFADIGQEIKMAGDGVLNLSTGISKLAGLGGEIEVLDNFPWKKLEDLAKAIEGKSIIQIVTGGGAGGMEATGTAVEAATGKSTMTSGSQDFSSMSNDEKAKAAGYDSWEEYKESGWQWKGSQEGQQVGVQPMPSTIGSELAAAGSTGMSSPVIINNNTGGNVSNVSSSSVNSSAPAMMPIFTGSALGFV